MKKFWNKRIGVVFALAIVAFSPLIFQRPEVVNRSDADDVLVVITPHNETIRSEFSDAFNSYYKKKFGKSVYIDWRTPGGTSEIRLVLDSKFSSAAEGDKGIGIDVFFGGGDYIFKQMAKLDRFQKLSIFTERKEWFEGDRGIPMIHTGETYYDSENYWVGVCLSQFGICYNRDNLNRLNIQPPRTWDDLADPKYFGTIAMADPTKSGSVARAFEMLVQQKIHESLKSTRRNPGETENMRKQRAIGYGWAEGLQLIQRIAANSRYFTDAATKIPHDVSQGDAAAGMCIDFYGRAYNEKLKKPDGTSRLEWIAPDGGSSLSVDPVAVFRGAPNTKLAHKFVEFLLSEEGQVLWNKRVGTVGGPKRRSLRRLPIRPSVYNSKNLVDFTDPEVRPYANKPLFDYQREITAPAFGAMRYIIKSMCIDAHKELKEAWITLVRNDMPDMMVARFHDVSYVSYVKTMGDIRKQLNTGNKIESAKEAKRMTSIFRRNYREAAELAREEGRKL